MALLSTLVDPFTTELDPTKWEFGYNYGTITVIDEHFTQSGEYVQINSINEYEFDSASVGLHFTDITDYETFLVGQNDLGFPEDRKMWMDVFGPSGNNPGSLQINFQGYDRGNDFTTSEPFTQYYSYLGPGHGGWISISYDSVNHRYWKMTNSVEAGVLTGTYLASPDGVDWTTLFSFSTTTIDNEEAGPYGVRLEGNEVTVVIHDFNSGSSSGGGGGGEGDISVPLSTPVELSSFAPTVSQFSYTTLNVPLSTPNIEINSYPPEILRYRVISFSPANESSIPLAINPEFRFLLIAGGTNVTTDLQVSSSSDFTSPIETSALMTDTVGIESNRITLESILTTGNTYYWRFRIHIDDKVTGWLGPYTFTVGATLGTVTYTGSWTVVSGTTDETPAIWFLFPATGKPGETITIFGQGINKSTSKIFVGTTEVPIVTKETIAEDPVLPPILDQTTMTVTVAHDELTFVLPEVESPGDVVTVEV